MRLSVEFAPHDRSDRTESVAKLPPHPRPRRDRPRLRQQWGDEAAQGQQRGWRRPPEGAVKGGGGQIGQWSSNVGWHRPTKNANKTNVLENRQEKVLASG